MSSDLEELKALEPQLSETWEVIERWMLGDWDGDFKADNPLFCYEVSELMYKCQGSLKEVVLYLKTKTPKL